MQRRLTPFAAALVAALIIHVPANAQQADDAAADKQQAMTALKTMGAYLRSLDHIQVSTYSTTDQVLTDGQAIQLMHRVDLSAQKPNRLYAHLVSSDKDRELFFNGKTVTLYGKQTGYYATVPAPATIQALSTEMEQRYGLELPLADLFTWGADKAQEAKITAATVVGDETVGKNTCTHYAYRQTGIDWQLWVQKGSKPLPCKLVITGLTDEARPQHSITYNWDDAKAADSIYQFTPPVGSKPITLKQIDTAQRAK